jgi:PAS domain S-box-containing protein
MILDAIAAAIRSRSLFELEHRVRRADGSVGWVLSRAVPISGPDGEIVEWFGASTDTTVRREAEERLRTAEERHLANLESLVQERTAELRASRDLLRAIIDSSVDMIQVFEAVRDETGQIVDFRWVLNNHTSESRFGKVHGQSLLERNPGVLVEGIFDDFKRVTETGEPVLKERYYAHEQFNGWFFQSVVKLDHGVATTTKDITDWKAAQEEVLRLRDEVAQVQVRETEERLAAIFVNAAVGLSELALNGRFLEVNDELCRILGRPREEVLRLSVPEVTHPEDVQATLEAVAAAQAGAGLVSLDKRYQRPDGTVVWANSRVSVLRHGEGQPDTLLAVTIDLTERRAAEEALRESEARFRQFGDASGDVLWIRDAETLEFEYISPAVEEVYGIRPEDLLGGNHMLRWLGLVIPEDRDLALDHTRRVRGGEHALNAFRILHRGDGSVRWIRDHSFPLLDAEGRVQRIGGMGHDATEEVELHGRLHVLVAELQHRTRNLMSVVRSVTDKTLSNSTSLDDFQGRIRDRLDALARVNSLLSRLDGGSRITFDELIRTELIAHGVTGPEEPMSQVSLEGPEGVRLRSSSVQTLALGLHELATNALKYGALSRPEGHLSVRWELLDSPEGEPRLRVDWRESGVPVLTLVPDSATGGEPTAPRRRGYGRELIEKALPYQLKAETSYELTPQGLRCRITLPVSSTMGRADGTAKEEPDD